MAELDRDQERQVLERATLLAAIQKMRAAVELIETRELPTDEAVTDAGVLCAGAGTLLELVFDARLDADVEGRR